MVRDDQGQIYTMEGIAAALIMLVTIYLVINATSVYTAGDTHIADMQLESLGSDALVMMDTAANYTVEKTPLQDIIEGTPLNTDNMTFKGMFLNYINAAGSGPTHNIQYYANYTCRLESGISPANSCQISSTRLLTGGEHTIRATRWVIVDDQPCCDAGDESRAVLVEVLLWRD